VGDPLVRVTLRMPSPFARWWPLTIIAVALAVGAAAYRFRARRRRG
jgi:hypothetical protein